MKSWEKKNVKHRIKKTSNISKKKLTTPSIFIMALRNKLLNNCLLPPKCGKNNFPLFNINFLLSHLSGFSGYVYFVFICLYVWRSFSPIVICIQWTSLFLWIYRQGKVQVEKNTKNQGIETMLLVCLYGRQVSRYISFNSPLLQWRSFAGITL